MARKIRLRYAGLVAFASRILSVFTGLGFMTALTRNVPLTEFGVWQYIFLLAFYFTFPGGISNYWVTRYIARGFKAAKTGLTINLTFSTLSLAILLLISPYAAKTVNTNPMYFTLGSFMIPAMLLVSSLEAIAGGCVPHVTSYGSATFEITKVILGLITIVYMKTGLYGAISSIIMAYLAQAIFLLVSLRGYVAEGNIEWNTAKKWLRTGWVPIYTYLVSLLMSLDAFIVTLLTFSSEPIALWKAALMITNVVGYSTLLASALYPKLLSGGSEKDVETSFKLVLMLAVPSTVGALLLAEPLLKIFKFEYVAASMILRVSTLTVFLGCIGGVLNSVIIGTEKIDTEDVPFRKLLKSRLFLLPTLSYIYAFTYLPLIYAFTTVIINLHIEPVYVNVVLACNLVALLASTPILIYKYRLAKRVLPFKFPIKSLAKYAVASAVLACILILFYPKGFFQTMMLVLTGAFAYFLILFIIDKDTRDLIARILSTLKVSDKKSTR